MCRFSGRKFPGYSLSFPFGNVGNPTKETSHLGMILTNHKMMVGMDYRIGFPAREREREREREWVVCDLIVLRIAMISIEHHCLSFLHQLSNHVALGYQKKTIPSASAAKNADLTLPVKTAVLSFLSTFRSKI